MSHTHTRLRISSTAPITVTHDALGGLDVVVVPVDAGQATVQLGGELDLCSVRLAAEVLDDQLKLGYRSIRLDLSRSAPTHSTRGPCRQVSAWPPTPQSCWPTPTSTARAAAAHESTLPSQVARSRRGSH